MAFFGRRAMISPALIGRILAEAEADRESGPDYPVSTAHRSVETLADDATSVNAGGAGVDWMRRSDCNENQYKAYAKSEHARE
jgi:hypothetical protein